MPLPIATFKLRFFDAHVRVVPANDGSGCPFEGPGIDLRGDDARAIFVLAEPLVNRIAACDPEATGAEAIRTVSIDRAHRRILVTIAASPRPRALRIEGADADPILALAVPIEDALGNAAARALARR